MKKLSHKAKTVILTMGIIGTAHADLNNWTGFYIGAEAGAAINKVEVRSQQLGFTSRDGTCNVNSKFFTLLPGIQAGYMYQFSNHWVSGVEANVTANTKQNETLDYVSAYNNNTYDRFTFENHFQSSVKGRLGRSINWNKNTLLPYVTAGVSVANIGLKYKDEGGDYYSENTLSPGWLVGTGMEWVYNKNWSVRTEYSYINYGTAINMGLPSVFGLIDPDGSAHAKLSSNNIMLSVNYWV